MKKNQPFFYCYALLLVFICTYPSSAQETSWVKGGGAPWSVPSGYNAHELVWETTTDDNGNVYILAEFMALGSVTFDTITFPIRSSATAIYRSKMALLSYNSGGHIRWGKIIEGRQGATFSALAYSRGQIYISGSAFENSGAEKVYFGNDTAMSASYLGSWIIKYDTSGSFQWIRAQGENNIPSFTATSNRYSKLLVQDTFLHCIKYINSTGAQLTPTVLSQKGIYDYTYTPQGDLVNLVRLPLADSMQMPGMTMPSTIYEPTNTLYLSINSPDSYNGSGVAVFDADRNLVRYDTFTTSGIPYGGTASTFRSGNALYTFGTYFGSDCTYRGETYHYAFPKVGRFGFVMKTDTANNLVWRKEFGSAASTDVGLMSWYGRLNKDRIVLTGFAKSIVTGSDTIIMPGSTGKVPIVILDSSGNLQKMDFWYNNNPTGGIEGGLHISCFNDNIYVGGDVLDSLWGGTSGYRSHGGASDFFVAKYSYECTPPIAAFTCTVKRDTAKVVFAGSTSVDSVRWDFGSGIYERADNHRYRIPGTYTICAVAYRACGTDTACQAVTIACDTPAAAFTYTTAADTVTVNYTGSAPVDSIGWSFGTGVYKSGTAARHYYGGSGTYEVCAIAYGSCANDTACQTISVTCAPPVAGFTFTAAAGRVHVTYAGSIPVDSVAWDFGAGIRKSGDTASYKYGMSGSYQVCAIAYGPCGNDTTCKLISVSTGTEIDESKTVRNILIYPNPATRAITIENAPPGTLMNLYDVSGRTLRTITIRQSKESIDLSGLPAGAYTIKVKNSEDNTSWKFIKEL